MVAVCYNSTNNNNLFFCFTNATQSNDPIKNTWKDGVTIRRLVTALFLYSASARGLVGAQKWMKLLCARARFVLVFLHHCPALGILEFHQPLV